MGPYCCETFTHKRNMLSKKIYRYGLFENEHNDEPESSLCFLSHCNIEADVFSISYEEGIIDKITLEEILGYLPPKTRNTLRKILSGYKMREISDEEGLMLKTINRRCERGCEKMKEFWKKDFTPPPIRKTNRDDMVLKYFLLKVHNLYTIIYFLPMSYFRRQNALIYIRSYLATLSL